MMRAPPAGHDGFLRTLETHFLFRCQQTIQHGAAQQLEVSTRIVMSEPGGEGGCVRYFCTAGNGMEPFLTEELRRKLEAEDVTQLSGKVLFSSSVRIHRVVELKAAERLFLLLKHEAPLQLCSLTSPAKAAAVLKSRLLGDRNQWTSAALTWSRLQGELAQGRRTAANTSSTPQGVMSRKEEGRGSEEQMEEEGWCESGKRAGEQREEERETRGLRGGEHEEEAQTLEKKRKREMSRENCGVEEQMLEKRIKRKNDEEAAEKERQDEDDEEERRMISSRGSVQSGSKKKNDLAEDCSVENMEHVKPAGGADQKPAQLSRITPEITSSVTLSFRISCKCTGSVSRLFSSQEVSRVMGVGLSRMMSWKVDLKNPQLEVSVYLSDDLCLLGIPLSRLPLAHRSYMKTTGLRSTIAWAMASLAHIQPGFCVLDPMCGVGTILIEAAQENKAACFLGVDIDDRQLQKANENIEFAELRKRIQLLKASSMALPLPSASVDALICDLPFGRKFGTKTNMAANLPVIVAEMERVLRVGGSLVLLLSPQLSFLLKKLLAPKDPMPQPGTKDCPCPPLSSTEQQTVQTQQGVKPSPPQERDTQTGQQLPPPPSSLKHHTTLRVSLGAIDGLIHKYVKVDA
ncbi:THUMP domain-containing protein 2 isoform X1 [Hippoglossus hippoglossus]|uniref:THUMP domain-containing protein 2 isoform X1 n=1 Tax=Hippoglossus hippoglossus TaxID=8267 RepID=UPI00148BB66A|nr:THUMP domain-containing protein 2 isoform X1 [Hippoglossus hippoglossus]